MTVDGPRRSIDEADDALFSTLEDAVERLYGANAALMNFTDSGKVAPLNERQMPEVMEALGEMSHQNMLQYESLLSGLGILRTSRFKLRDIRRQCRNLTIIVFFLLGVVVVETGLLGWYIGFVRGYPQGLARAAKEAAHCGHVGCERKASRAQPRVPAK